MTAFAIPVASLEAGGSARCVEMHGPLFRIPPTYDPRPASFILRQLTRIDRIPGVSIGPFGLLELLSRPIGGVPQDPGGVNHTLDITPTPKGSSTREFLWKGSTKHQ